MLLSRGLDGTFRRAGCQPCGTAEHHANRIVDNYRGPCVEWHTPHSEVSTVTDRKPTRERVPELLDQGLTVREIASVLGISTQAVYKHIHRLGLSLDRTDAA